MSKIQVTQQMLTEAESAYHSLVLGQAVAEITDMNGEKVRFTPAKRSDLALYIQQLREALCANVSVRPVNGPAGFLF